MRRMILASHGSLAEGMLSAAKMIIGDCTNIQAYGLDRYGQPNVIYDLIVNEVNQYNDCDYVILCDINGGSVHNCLMHLMDRNNVFLVTGMTLSMILELQLASAERETKELLEHVVESAKANTLIYDHDSVISEIEKGLEDDSLW